MNEQLKTLIELQNMDTKFIRMQRAIKAGPAEIAKAEEVYNAAQAEADKLEDELKHAKAGADGENLDAETCNAEIKKLEEKMKTVKNNKEYTIVKEAIESYKERCEQHENAGVALLEKAETLSGEVEAKKAEAAEKKEALEKLKSEIENDNSSMKQEVAQIREKRKLCMQKLDEETLATYEQVLRTNGGLAVVTVKDESCQGCFRMLYPVTHSRVLAGDVITCPGCGRFIYEIVTSEEASAE